MTALRWTAWLFLTLAVALALCSDMLAPYPYAVQHREALDAPPSREFLLGTDALGRDRLSRLLYGSRISLLLAPAASLLATVCAALIGGTAGYLGGVWERALVSAADLFLSLPWLFLLLTVRAVLPLEVPAAASLLITFTLLGVLGWAGPARVIRSGIRSLREAEFLRQARACGIPRWRLLTRHLLPNVGPLLMAQFLLSVPLFILSEANLGLLGLGVSEPLPSWGGLLRELQTSPAVLVRPAVLLPLAWLMAIVGCLQFLAGERSSS